MFEFSWCESFPMSWLHMFYPYASDFGIIMGLTYFSGDILISDNCLTYIYIYGYPKLYEDCYSSRYCTL